jgi:hypothetical protein
MAIPGFKRARFLIPVAAVGLALAGCGSSGSGSAPANQANSNLASAEAQSAAQGDIPDNQKFLRYRVAGACDRVVSIRDGKVEA